MNLFSEYWEIWLLGIFAALIVAENCYEYKKLAAAKNVSFRFVLLPIIYLSMSLFLCAGLPFMLVYHQLVKIVLLVKYGSKFAGLLEGQDVIHALENKTPIHFLFIVKYSNKNSQAFYEVARETMRKAFLTKFREEPKRFGIVRKGFGYTYMLREEVSFEDCFKQLKAINSSTGEISKGDVTRLMGEYSNAPLPKNRKALWEVLVGTQPVKWRKEAGDDSVKFYPVILRAHHSLADAIHILRGVIGLFADENVDDSSNTHNHIEVNKISKILRLPKNALVLFLNSILTRTEANLLHGPVLTNRKIFCINVEESSHYRQAVQRIKQKFPGSSFEDIFITAFTASFSEYFRKHSAPLPEYLVVEVPTVPEAVKLARSSINEIIEQKINCRNNLSACVRKLPIVIAARNCNSSLVDTLEYVKKERCLVKSSFEVEVNYWLLSTGMKIAPEPIINMLLKGVHEHAGIITNIPGPSYITVLGGCPIQDIIAFPAHRRRAGIGAAIFTYNDRIQLSLVVDKALISNEEEVQRILDQVFKYIDVLDTLP